MSEKQPVVQVMPEIVANGPENLPPRDEAIDAVRGEMETLQARMTEAEEKVATPGFKATANDIIEARAHLKELRETDGARLDALREMWTEYGGDAIDSAQEAVDNLNFRSDASDHVAAKTGLRDAKDAFYAKLQESMQEKELEDPHLQDAAEIAKFIRDNPELAEKSGVAERMRDILGDIDKALAGNDDAEREALAASTPVDNELSSDDEEAKLAASSAVENNLEDEGLIEDKERAHEMALVEEDKRNVTPEEIEQAHDDAEYEDEIRNLTPEDIEQAHEEAIEEDEARDRENQPKVKWWKNPMAYLGGIYSARRPERGSLAERYRGSSKLTKVAIGAVALVAVAGAIKLGYDNFLSDANIGPDNLPDGGNGGSTPTPEVEPNAPSTPETPAAPEFSSDAATVTPGEGWYQTFNEMNIPQSEWSNLLEKAGPELESNGWAYRMPNGEWGISQPGRLPQGMLELIQKNR